MVTFSHLQMHQKREFATFMLSVTQQFTQKLLFNPDPLTPMQMEIG